MAGAIEGTVFATIFDHHADTVALGGLAERAGVAHLVLTHLIPHPTTPPTPTPSSKTSGTAATPAPSPSATT